MPTDGDLGDDADADIDPDLADPLANLMAEAQGPVVITAPEELPDADPEPSVEVVRDGFVRAWFDTTETHRGQQPCLICNANVAEGRQVAFPMAIKLCCHWEGTKSIHNSEWHQLYSWAEDNEIGGKYTCAAGDFPSYLGHRDKPEPPYKHVANEHPRCQ